MLKYWWKNILTLLHVWEVIEIGKELKDIKFRIAYSDDDFNVWIPFIIFKYKRNVTCRNWINLSALLHKEKGKAWGKKPSIL